MLKAFPWELRRHDGNEDVESHDGSDGPWDGKRRPACCDKTDCGTGDGVRPLAADFQRKTRTKTEATPTRHPPLYDVRGWMGVCRPRPPSQMQVADAFFASPATPFYPRCLRLQSIPDFLSSRSAVMNATFRSLCLYLLALLACRSLPAVSAQRFLKSNSLDQELHNSMRAMNGELNELSGGMTREMFLMRNKVWELALPQQLPDPKVDGSRRLDARLKRHIQKYLSLPLEIKLQDRRGKYGYRAVGRMQNGLKLRGFWREKPSQSKTRPNYLECSYDEAVRDRLSLFEIEVQLPPIGREKVLPSVVYQLAVETTPRNPDAIIPRGSGKLTVYPKGDGTSGDGIEVGTCSVFARMKTGLIDPNWARGRPFFRKGRSPGFI